MFAFENWHSALEMKRYIKRYIHHIGGLPDFTALRFTKYNQYESMILPMVKYLEKAGVAFHYNTRVVNVEFHVEPDRKQATRIEIVTEGETRYVDLTEDDLVFITNGGCVENSAMGSQNTPAPYNRKSSRAVDGICGGVLQPRVRTLETRINSAMTVNCVTG